MPRSIDQKSSRPLQATGSFRKRLDELEQRRNILAERLANLGDKARAHPSYARARTLLTKTFCKASLMQRAAVLQAADWVIDLIQMSITTL
jgi:hypothetical protein